MFSQACRPLLRDIILLAFNGQHRCAIDQRVREVVSRLRLRTKFGERAFPHAGPSARNRLPEDIRAEPGITNFWKLLKLTILILRLTFNNCILSFYL